MVSNIRYMLWMLCRGIYDPPNSQYEYINWINIRRHEFDKQTQFHDFDKYLMWFVRDYLAKNCKEHRP